MSVVYLKKRGTIGAAAAGSGANRRVIYSRDVDPDEMKRRLIDAEAIYTEEGEDISQWMIYKADILDDEEIDELIEMRRDGYEGLRMEM